MRSVGAQLQDVTDEQLGEVLDAFKVEAFEAEQTIVAQGAAGSKFYILLKGDAQVSTPGKGIGGRVWSESRDGGGINSLAGTTSVLFACDIEKNPANSKRTQPLN